MWLFSTLAIAAAMMVSLELAAAQTPSCAGFRPAAGDLGYKPRKNSDRCEGLYQQEVAGSLELLSLEPISKSPEQDDEASELNEAEEILGIVLPAHKDTTLPLYPGKEALYQPAPCVSPQSAAVLRRLLHTA